MASSFTHQLHTFSSGLRLVTVPMEGIKSATALVLVGTGSKYETKDINGISHFLEHMMFKGTTKRPDKLQIAHELDSIGAEYNAFTSQEYTGYYARASAAKLNTIMDVVFDIFLNSKLDQKDIDVERGPIIEEINMYQDIPQQYVSQLFEKLLYGDQPAGWDIAGTKEVVSSLQRAQFVSYFDTHYIASNTIVAVAGGIDPEMIRQRVGEYFQHIRQADRVSKLPVIEKQSAPQALVHYKETDQTHFILGFRSYNMFDDRKYPLSVLATILGGGMSSRLFQEVRDKRGLAYYVSAGSDEMTDTGVMAAQAGVNNAKAIDAVKVVIDEIRKIRDGGVTDDELRRAQDRAEGGLVLALENSRTVANAYAAPVLFQNTVLTPEEELAKIKAVTREDIAAVAADVIQAKALNLSLIGPFKDPEPFQKLLTL